MRSDIWEDFISLNSSLELKTSVLGPASEYVVQADGSVVWNESLLPRDIALGRDTAPLPLELDRELYYGPNHYNYWASGIRDYLQMRDWLDEHGVVVETVLDIGCASGRIIRHLHYQSDFKKVMGCDINRLHVDWVIRYLPKAITVFQNTSIPYVPLPDGSVDLVTAFSVFTHIESFDTTWLMELRRILRPGGIAWLTVQSDRTWREIKPSWPLYNALSSDAEYQKHADSSEIPADRQVYRWIGEKSYSANVFYRENYLRGTWGRFMSFIDMFPAIPLFQDIVVLQK